MLEVGDLRLDPATRQVWRGETEIELSPKEFALLEAFMRRPGRRADRLELLEHAWDFAYENRSNVIDVYIRYLREKIDRPFGPDAIETVRGAGYRLREDGGSLSRLPIRLRLTLAFTLVMAVVLVAVGLFVYLRVSADLESALDKSLQARADDLATTAAHPESASPGAPRLVSKDESLAQVIGPGGRVQFSSPGLGRVPVLTGDELAQARRGAVFVDRNGVARFDEHLRLLARPAGDRVVVVGATREDREEALASLERVLLIGLPHRPAARGARGVRGGHGGAEAGERHAVGGGQISRLDSLRLVDDVVKETNRLIGLVTIKNDKFEDAGTG